MNKEIYNRALFDTRFEVCNTYFFHSAGEAMSNKPSFIIRGTHGMDAFSVNSFNLSSFLLPVYSDLAPFE